MMRALFAVILLACTVSIQPLDAVETDVIQDEADVGWVLKITEKTFNESTNTVHVVVENTSPDLTVTAFGIYVVHDLGEGRRGATLTEQQKLPGEGLAPGESQEEVLHLGYDHDGLSHGVVAIKAMLNYEVLSDTTSHGDEAAVEKVFARRRALYRETVSVLERLDAARSGKDGMTLEDFWDEQTSRREKAQDALNDINPEMEPAERLAHGARLSLSSLTAQFQERISAGEPIETTLSTAVWLIETYQLQPVADGLRAIDFEMVDRGLERL